MRYASAGTHYVDSPTPPGTWRCMGAVSGNQAPGSTDPAAVSLFVRIS
jgi:hypothetical protein